MRLHSDEADELCQIKTFSVALARGPKSCTEFDDAMYLFAPLRALRIEIEIEPLPQSSHVPVKERTPKTGFFWKQKQKNARRHLGPFQAMFSMHQTKNNEHTCLNTFVFSLVRQCARCNRFGPMVSIFTRFGTPCEHSFHIAASSHPCRLAAVAVEDCPLLLNNETST